MSLDRLRLALADAPIDKPLPNTTRQDVYDALYDCWESLGGSSDQGTTKAKLHRTEEMVWTPPLLRFVLERHGSTVNGSSRAELHHWEVDLDQGTAKIAKRGRRQLYGTDDRFKAKAKAHEIAELILRQADHECLVWKDERNRVQVLVSKIVSEFDVKKTGIGRRKRLRVCLTDALAPHGWVRADVGTHLYFEKR